jgi:hypothetical protein
MWGLGGRGAAYVRIDGGLAEENIVDNVGAPLRDGPLEGLPHVIPEVAPLGALRLAVGVLAPFGQHPNLAGAAPLVPVDARADLVALELQRTLRSRTCGDRRSEECMECRKRR